MLLSLSSLSAYTFYVLGRLCHETGSSSLGQLWETEIGARSSWVIDLGTFVYTMGCSLTYSIVLGDFFKSLAGGVGPRQLYISLITALALYPLCLLKSLSALAPISIVGNVGVVATCAFMVLRCVTPAYQLPNGRFLRNLPTLPAFNTRTGPVNPLSFLVLGSMLSSASSGQFSAPQFLNAVKGQPHALRKYARVTIFGFASVALVNLSILVAGFLTFGGNSAGVILNNYATADPGAALCRLLQAVSVVGGFPFLIRSAKASLYSCLYGGMYIVDTQLFSTRLTTRLFVDKPVPDRLNFQITTLMVLVLTFGAFIMENAGMVVGLNGALMGSAIVYVFPSLLFLAKKRGNRAERMLNRGLVGFGVVAGLAGAAVTLLNTYAPQMLR